MAIVETIINKNYSGFNPVQFGQEDCAPCHSYGPAVRDHWLLHYVVSGTGVFIRDGKTHTPKAGDMFVIPPFAETFYKADKKDPWHYQWIGFEAGEPLPECFENAVIRQSGIGNIFEDMRRCHHMENGKSAFLSGKIWELISLLLDRGAPEPDYVEKAIHFMNSEYMNKLTVQDIAKTFGLDRCYFSTLFTKSVGISPSQYLINLRLEKAATLMITHKEKPSVAAFSSGYTDIYNFSKSFKKKYGLSPRQYIEKHRSGK